MIQATILAPVVLVVVLAVSAVAKLRDPASLDDAFVQLRVPSPLGQPWLRRSVPWLELALAAGLLLPAPVGVLAAVGSLALFAVYTVLIARAWRAPEEASCHCFGSLTTGRVSGWTVARNGVLLGVSALAVADAAARPPVVVRLLDAGVAAWLVGAAVVALLVFTIVHEPDAGPSPEPAAVSGVGEEGEEYVRLPIPYSRVTNAAGHKVTLRQLPARQAQLLVWVSVSCGSCQDVLARVEDWQRAMPEVGVRPVVTTPGALDERLPSLVDQVLVDDEQALSVFGWYGTPTAVLLGSDGLIAGGPVTGGPAVIELAEEMIEQLVEARADAAVAAAAPVTA